MVLERRRACTAVAWTLAKPDVGVAVIGACHLRDIEETRAAASLELTPDVLAGIDEVLAAAVAVVGASPGG